MKFYFTFGFNQKHEGCYHIVDSKDYGEARKEMFEKFGSKWAFQYTEEKWMCENGKTQAEEYNLREIK